MAIIKPRASTVIRGVRKDYGYTQKEVAGWIGTSPSNYSRKEKSKDGVTLTADEFLKIMREFQKRGPKKKYNEKLQNILNDLIYK